MSTDPAIRNGFVPPDHRVLRPRPGVAVVEVLGEHDLATRDTVEDLFLRLVDEGGLLVVDVSEATFVDSSFLNALVKAHQRADENGSRMRVQFGSTPVVYKAFEISGLMEYLDCVPDREQALLP